jgi:hypothetical protein
MQQIGWSLVKDGAEIMHWGDAIGACSGVPDLIRMPNGDHVHCPQPGAVQDHALVARYGERGGSGVSVQADKVVVGVSVTSADVEAEKARRLALFTFNGAAFDFVDDKGSESNIQGAYSLAFSAIIQGKQAGDLRWADPASDFGWIAHDNSIVTMDAPTVIEFGKAAAAYKSKLIFRARALKNMNPIPADYASESYWT